ncbi:MAG: type II toxin-antitoxin system HicB family antitoxin [Solirubrobacteraceae bacterium]
MKQTVRVRIHFEDQAYWATVDEHPGVFATGDTLDELRGSLEEGLSLVITGAHPQERPVRLSPLSGGSAAPVSSAAPVAFSAELTLA